jgi:hypothetical protein
MSRGVRWIRALQPIHLDRAGDTEAGALVVGAITPRGGEHHVCGTDSDSLHACAPKLSPTPQGEPLTRCAACPQVPDSGRGSGGLSAGCRGLEDVLTDRRVSPCCRGDADAVEQPGEVVEGSPWGIT